ncbi:hypothetical protein RB653_008838 [Dictyostelium firmibasis]|uniref:EGF-like domain-containing protein n=1 Tax=Dictyostelium firmibasis TaxID=79012 RepID=A0AAN7TT66_9MYCE
MKEFLNYLIFLFFIFWLNNFCFCQPTYNFYDFTNPSTLNTYPPTSNNERCEFLITILGVNDDDQTGPPQSLSYITNNSISPNIIQVFSNLSSALFTFGFNSGYGDYSLNISGIPYTYGCKEINISKLKFDSNKLFFSEFTNFASFFKIEGLAYPLTLSYDESSYSITNIGNYYYYIDFKTTFYTKQTNGNPWKVDIIFPGTNVFSIYFYYNNETIPITDPQDIVDIKLCPPNQNYTEIGFQYGPLTTFKSTSTKRQTQLFLWELYALFFVMAKPIYGSFGNITYVVLTFPSLELQQYSLYYLDNKKNFSIGFSNQVKTSVDYGAGITSNETLYNFNDLNSLINIYTGGYFGLQNYSSKYFGYSFQQNTGIEMGVVLQFPFGFVGGNNSYFHINYTKLASYYSYDEFSMIFQDYIGGKQNKIQNIPPVAYALDYSVPQIISFQSNELDQFIILVTIHIKSHWGINFFTLNLVSQTTTITINHRYLTSGSIYDGVWEFTVNGLLGKFEKITMFTLYDSIHNFYLGSYFSLYYPTQTLKVNLERNIKNISFLYNNITATNQTISNIMFLNFTNIEEYKDQSIGLLLIDSKSLRDMLYDDFVWESSGIMGQENNYYYAEYDSTKNRFQIRFNIPANTIPGKLDFILSFSDVFKIYSPSLPDNYQLYVNPSIIDIQGPVFTSITKNPSGKFGWLLTIEDSINGLDSGLISVFGLSDSSTYNFTIKPSNAVKGDKWKGDYEIYLPLDPLAGCITQDFIIKYVELLDTKGNLANYMKFFNYRESSNLVKTLTNPFIYFYNDSTVNKITALCSTNNIGAEFSSPKLISFISSKKDLDVGLINTIDFKFQSYDISGIKQNQFPIVYLTTRNFEMVQCISKNISTFSETTNFECTIDIPIGFGYPTGILLSVYGFINNRGYFSGYCSQQLLEMNFSYFISTNNSLTIDQPYIEKSNKISNYGGDLWIYGRGFGRDLSAWIKFGDGSESFNQYTIKQFYSTAILIDSILPTNQSFTIFLKSPSKISNEYTVKPIEFYFNYVAPTSPPSSPMPTNPPKKCLGNPQCGGIDHGYCNNGVGCICYSPWVGEDCTSKVIVIPQPSKNTTDPTIEVPINGGGNETTQNNLYRSLISLVSLRELDFDGKQVKSFKFDKWIYTEINNSTNKYLSTISNKNNNGVIVETNVTVVLQWFEKNDTVLFAGQTLRMNPSSIKYTINITSYSFAQNLNSLQLVMSASLQSSTIDDICSSKSFGNTSDGDNSNYMKLKVNDHSVYGRFIKRAIVDNKIISVKNSILDDLVDTTSNYHTSETLIGISIPFFNDQVLVDPDFSFLIDNSPASSNDENSICTSSSSKLSTVQIVGIVIGSVAFAAVGLDTQNTTLGYFDFCGTDYFECFGDSVTSISLNSSLFDIYLNYSDLGCFSSLLISVDLNEMVLSPDLISTSPGFSYKVQLFSCNNITIGQIPSETKEIYINNLVEEFKANINFSNIQSLKSFVMFESNPYKIFDYPYFYNDISSYIPLDQLNIYSSNIPSFNFLNPSKIQIILGKSFNPSSLVNFNDLSHFNKTCDISLRVLQGSIKFPFLKANNLLNSVTIQSYIDKPLDSIDLYEFKVKTLIISNVSYSFNLNYEIPFTNFPPTIQTFSFSDGKINSMPKNINIQSISFINNTMSGPIGKLSDYGSNVKNLFISQNKLSGPIDESFCSLQNYDFSNNTFTSVPKCFSCFFPKDPNYSSELKSKFILNQFGDSQPSDCNIVLNLVLENGSLKLYGDYIGLYRYGFNTQPNTIDWVWMNYTYYIGTLKSGSTLPDIISFKYDFYETNFTLFTSSTPPKITTVGSLVNSKTFIFNGEYFNYNITETKVTIGNKVCNINSTTFSKIECTVDEFFDSSLRDLVTTIQVGKLNQQITVTPYTTNTVIQCDSSCSGVCYTSNGTCASIVFYVSSVVPIQEKTEGTVQLYGSFGEVHNGLSINIGGVECYGTYIDKGLINCTLKAVGSGIKLLNITQNGVSWVSKSLFSYLPPTTIKSCPNNCFSSLNKGVCNTTLGQCECIQEYSGIDCSFFRGGDHPPTNRDVDENTGKSKLSNQETNYEIEIIQLLEVDINDKIVKNYSLENNWKFKNVTSGSIFYFSQKIQNSNCELISIIDQINRDQTYTFAGVDFYIQSGSIKLTIAISNYTYESSLNTLKLQMKTIANQESTNCNTKSTDIDTSGIVSNSTLNYVTIKKNNKVLVGRFINRVLSDGRSTFITSNVIPSDKDSLILQVNLPHCVKECIIDPDFSVLVSPDYLDNCPTKRKWVIPVAVVVSVVGAGFLVGLSVLLYKKNQMAIRIRLSTIKLSRK